MTMSYIALHILSGSHYYWSCCYSPFHPHFTPFHMKGAWLRENNGLLETRKSTIENVDENIYGWENFFLMKKGKGRKQAMKGGSFGWRIIITYSILYSHVWSIRFAVEIKGSHISGVEGLRSDLARMEKAATFQPIKGAKKTNVLGPFKRTLIY
jgi:hypothetical protein